MSEGPGARGGSGRLMTPEFAERMAWIDAQKLDAHQEFIAHLVLSLEDYASQDGAGIRLDVDWPAFVESLKGGGR